MSETKYAAHERSMKAAAVSPVIKGFASTLAQERYNGKPLRDLSADIQIDLILEAKAMFERYKEQ